MLYIIVLSSSFSVCSVAILQYLCAKNPVADDWYPSDVKARARVDEYLAWYHLNTRYSAASIFVTKVVFSLLILLLYISLARAYMHRIRIDYLN